VKKSRVIVFVKNAIAGKVKTRLAKTIGDEEALVIYKQLLRITERETSLLEAEKEVWYAWEVGEGDIWDDEKFRKRVQIEGDLGEKMTNAFKKSFEEGLKKVVLIGSDCPTLTAEILEEAFEKLENNDVVFGPSSDGGYYLIGMSSFKPEVLSDISWSTEEVMKQTEKRASKNDIKLAKLQILNDIDNEQDWNEYLAGNN
jgi:rSAM/selenodomain-associated transferase 1